MEGGGYELPDSHITLTRCFQCLNARREDAIDFFNSLPFAFGKSLSISVLNLKRAIVPSVLSTFQEAFVE